MISRHVSDSYQSAGRTGEEHLNKSKDQNHRGVRRTISDPSGRSKIVGSQEYLDSELPQVAMQVTRATRGEAPKPSNTSYSIIYGFQPYILRPTDPKGAQESETVLQLAAEKECKLSGDCYMYGAMDGEFFKMDNS